MLLVQEVYIRSEIKKESFFFSFFATKFKQPSEKKPLCGQYDAIWSPLFTLDCFQLE